MSPALHKYLERHPEERDWVYRSKGRRILLERHLNPLTLGMSQKEVREKKYWGAPKYIPYKNVSAFGTLKTWEYISGSKGYPTYSSPDFTLSFLNDKLIDITIW